MLYVQIFLLLLSFCKGQNLDWEVVKKATRFGQNVTLFCKITNCCQRNSGWDLYDPDRRTLWIDVKNVKVDSKAKYVPYVTKEGIGLTIRNITENDLGIGFTCTYGFKEGKLKNLTEEAVIVKDEIHKKRLNPIIAGLIGICTVLMILIITVVIIIWKYTRRKKGLIVEYERNPGNNREFWEGDRCIIQYKSNKSKPKVKWYFEGTRIKQSEGKLLLPEENDFHTHKLEILNLATSDSGKYAVSAGIPRKKITLAVPAVKELFEEELKLVKILDDGKEQIVEKVYEGDKVALLCKVKNPKLNHKWLKDDAPLKGDLVQKTTDMQHRLEIPCLEIGNSGEYTICVNNQKRSYRITVEELFEEELKLVTILDDGKEQIVEKVYEGDKVALLCKVKNPKLNHKWLKDDAPLKGDLVQKTTDMQHRLEIPCLEIGNSGEYTICVNNRKRSYRITVEDARVRQNPGSIHHYDPMRDQQQSQGTPYSQRNSGAVVYDSNTGRGMADMS